MHKIRGLLDWLEGFAENIKARPTPDQWKRITEKLSEMRAELDSVPESTGQVAQPVAKKQTPKPSTPTQWLAQYTGAMVDLGCDIDTAKEFARDIGEIDLSANPREVAETHYDKLAEAK